MVLGQHRMVRFKVLRSFYANCGYSVQTSSECKTDRSAVLTVLSGLDPHMINENKDEIKLWFVSFGVFFYQVFLSGLV
jgi:hypothetical protein